ncbi:hypothetical protein JCM24511_09672 [Saitozyma sp. JCM 24511]|nr:hypothetical protein JCM24511_09672 [Saitozyma sp. JCM 24511]
MNAVRFSICFLYATSATSPSPRLEETLDVPGLRVQVNVVEARPGGETWHGGHVSHEGVDEAGAGGETDVADREGEPGGDTLPAGVVGEGQSSLGHADGETAVALSLVSLDLGLGLGRKRDAVGAVHLLGDDLHLLDKREVEVVKELELGLVFAGLDDGLGEFDSALTTPSPVVGGDSIVGADGQGVLLNKLHLGDSVVPIPISRIPRQIRSDSRKAVDRDDDLEAELLCVLDVLAEVGASLLEQVEVLLGVNRVEGLAGRHRGTATVHLEGSDGRDEDHGVGAEARHAGLDVAELLHADVRTEASLGDDVTAARRVVALLDTGELECDAVRDDGRVAVRDVGKGTGVDEDGGTLEGLHESGLDRVLHEDGHGAGTADVLGGDGLAGLARGDDHAAEAGTHVGNVLGQGEHGHDLGGDGNVECGLAGEALLRGRLTHSDSTQVSVVDVQHAVPGDGRRVNVETSEARLLLLGKLLRVDLVNAEPLQSGEHRLGKRPLALLLRAETVEQRLVLLRRLVEHPGVDGSGEQVVGRGDSVDVAGEMEVELGHRDDLRVATTGGAALDAERRALGRLTNTGNGVLLEVRAKSLSETDGGGRLALAKRRRGDTRHDDVLSVELVLEPVEDRKLDLCLESSVALELVGLDSHLLGDGRNELGLLRDGDLNVTRDLVEHLEREGNQLALPSGRPSSLGGFKRVVHEHGDGHGANTSGNGGDVAGDLAGGLVVHITDETLARFLRGVRDVVSADVDDDGARLEPLAPDKLGLANSGDDDVGGLDNILEVLGSGMALGHSGILLPQQGADGRADNVGATENDGVGPGKVKSGRLNELDHAGGGAGGEVRLRDPAGEETDVLRVEAVDVLGHGHRIHHALLLCLAGTLERELDKDPRDLLVRVGVSDQLEHLLHARSLWLARLLVRVHLDVLHRHAGLLRRLELHTDVRRRGRARAELEDDEVRRVERGCLRVELLDGLGQRRPDLPASKQASARFGLSSVTPKISRSLGNGIPVNDLCLRGGDLGLSTDRCARHGC